MLPSRCRSPAHADEARNTSEDPTPCRVRPLARRGPSRHRRVAGLRQGIIAPMTTSSPESAQPAGQAGAIEIVESAYDHPDVVRLVWALHDEQVGRYGFADAVEADPPSTRRRAGCSSSPTSTASPAPAADTEPTTPRPPRWSSRRCTRCRSCAAGGLVGWWRRGWKSTPQITGRGGPSWKPAHTATERWPSCGLPATSPRPLRHGPRPRHQPGLRQGSPRAQPVARPE